MTIKELQELIDQYWEGTTSIDQEQMIRAFFASNRELPTELDEWRDWFTGQDTINQTGLGSDFDEKMLSYIGQPKTTGIRVRRFRILIPSAVAVILGILLWFGHLYFQKSAYPDELTVAEMENYEMVKELLYFTSSKMNQTELLVGESLSKIGIINEYIKIE